MASIKQLVIVRRKAGLTKEEFFDYHYQIHGAISTAPTPDETPAAYFQTHFTDAAYHAESTSKIPNSHPSWAFGDDATELYFENSEHLTRVFQSDWVKQKVGPDGANFSDFSTVIPMLVQETEVPLGAEITGISESSSQSSNTFVAMYFVAFENTNDRKESSETLITRFVSCLADNTTEQVQRLTVNTPVDVGFDLGAYFGGDQKLQYQYVFTISLRGRRSVSAIRKAQADYEKKTPQLDLPATWIAFGERAPVFDRKNGVKFDVSRQPFKGT